jgi:hypothetical protein
VVNSTLNCLPSVSPAFVPTSLGTVHASSFAPKQGERCPYSPTAERHIVYQPETRSRTGAVTELFKRVHRIYKADRPRITDFASTSSR